MEVERGKYIGGRLKLTKFKFPVKQGRGSFAQRVRRNKHRVERIEKFLEEKFPEFIDFQ